MNRIVLLFFLFISTAFAQQLEIQVDQHKVQLPYWPAKDTRYGAVLMVRGGAAQWSVVLARFARQLSANGWSVVLLNCNTNVATPWVDLLPEVISTMRQNKNRRIVLVHYGEQLSQSFDYFSKPQAKMVNGLVMLSAYDEQMDKLPNLRFPLFDIAGQFDYDSVLAQMGARGQEFKQRNYLSVEMPGADHEYEYSEKMLLAFMHGWMAKLPAFNPEPKPIAVSYIEPVYTSLSPIAFID